jgi:hypothetical protein
MYSVLSGCEFRPLMESFKIPAQAEPGRGSSRVFGLAGLACSLASLASAGVAAPITHFISFEVSDLIDAF